MAQTSEEINKVVLLGNFEVGKTTLFTRFKTGQFEEVDRQTRAEAEYCKTWQADGKEYRMTLYDTAGMERFDSTVPPTYFRNAKAVVLVYDITNPESIGDVSHWAQSMSAVRIGKTEMVRVLVGNKLDLATRERDEQVSTNRGRDTAEALDIDSDLVYEVSAKTGERVSEMFDTIARRIYESSTATQTKVTLPQRNSSGEKCSC